MTQYIKKRNQYNRYVVNLLIQEFKMTEQFVYQSLKKTRKSKKAYEIRKMYWILSNKIETVSKQTLKDFIVK